MPVDFPEMPFLDFFGASPVDDLDLSLCDDSLFMDGFNFPESAETSPSTSGRCSPFEDDAFLSFNPLETVHECDSLLSELFEISEQRDTLSDDFLFPFDDNSTSGLSDDDSSAKSLKMKVPKKKGRRPNPIDLSALKPAKVRKNSASSLPSTPSSPCSSPVEGETVKRDSHNVSERQRRRDLKVSFQKLRLCIPAVAEDPRVHTGQILKQAIDFIRHLQQEEAKLINAKTALLF